MHSFTAHRWQCLIGIADARVNKAGASSLLFQLAHESFKVPGDPGFSLAGLVTAPVNRQEEGEHA